MPRNPKVLIFSIVDFSLQNGGVICSLNILESIRTIPGLDFVLVTCAQRESELANVRVAADLGLNHVFLPLVVPQRQQSEVSEHCSPIWRRSLTIFADKYYFYLERFSRRQQHLDVMLTYLVAREAPDLIVVDGSWSALCVPSVFLSGIDCCFITHNHEVALHTDLKLYVQDVGANRVKRSGLRFWLERNFNWLSNVRFKRCINTLYRQCTGIIALTRNDIPDDLPPHVVKAVVPPLLPEREILWRYSGSHQVLFVGNAHYFANRLAIEWLCYQLAPELLRVDCNIAVNIIGATSDEVSLRCRCSNVNFLGRADRAELVRHMTCDDLLISPTAQSYGAKLKLAECASFGMPFIATDTAMSGLPFLTSVPRIDLKSPRPAAELVARYVNSPDLLSKLSQDILDRMRLARSEQSGTLNAFIHELLNRTEVTDPPPYAPTASCARA